jgi:hypothetical protein
MTDTRATLVIVEHWMTTTNNMQVTIVVVEHWASVADATVVPGGGGDAVRVMVMA